MKKKQQRSRWNLTAYIIVSLVTIAALFFCFAMMSKIKRQMNESATFNLFNTTRVIESTLDDSISKDFETLNMVGELYRKGEEMKGSQIKTLCEDMNFEWIGIVDEKGNGAGCFEGLFQLSDIPLIEQWNPETQGHSDAYFGDSGRLQMVLWTPIYQNGKMIGTVFGNVVVSKYYSANIFTFYEGEGRTYLFDASDGSWILKSMGKDGRARLQENIYSLLLSSGNDEKDIADLKKAVEEQRTGAAIYMFNEEPSYVCFMPLSESEDWYVVTVIARNLLLRESDQVQWMIHIMMAVLFVTIIFLGIIVAIWTTKRARESETKYRETLFANISSNIDSAFLIYEKSSRKTAFVSENVERLLGVDRDWLEADAANLFDWCGLLADDSNRTDFLAGTLNTPAVCEVCVADVMGAASRYIRLELIPADLGQEIAVLTDITKDKDIQRSLLEAMEKSESVSRAKNEFMSAMSHDIRTPMNAVIGMTAIASAHLDDKKRVKDCLCKISEASAHLLDIINEVLDMSRLESGRMELLQEKFNLAELIQNVLNVNYPGIVQKKQNIKIHIHPMEHEQVIGDMLQLKRIAVNLISNAIKYTPQEGTIIVTLREKPSVIKGHGCYELMVQDNGIGMSQEFQKKLFQPFEREDDVRTSRVQGTGLGMAIAKNIITLMMGDIRVESEKNKGTTVYATINLQLDDQRENRYETLASLPVLVVDDDDVICETVTDMLFDIGMIGEWADNGADAVRKVKERHEKNEDYLAVLLDWKMPEMNGVETARRIRAELGNNIPIIILTAYDWSEIEDEAIEAGVNAFLSKPIYKTKLSSTMMEVVAGGVKQRETTNPMDGKHFLGNKKVLLAEDNELNKEIVVEFLHMMGIQTEHAENGIIAVEAFAKSRPGFYDMILMDIQMPGMDGYAATIAIREMKRPDAQRIPIVAITADAFAKDIKAAYAAGMNGHLSKPVSADKLAETMMRFLSGN